MITSSDFVADETDRLTPATMTVLILDADFSCDDDIASYVSAFNNKSLSANQFLTAYQQISRVDNFELMVVTHTARNRGVSSAH